MPLPAIVLIGPALTVFTRMPIGPRSRARYRVTASSPALATPIQSYTGHGTCGSKSSETTEPPCSRISGSNPTATAFNEYVLVWTAVGNDAHGGWRELPPSADCGAEAHAG